MKNRESASKSRKKKKAMFESLKAELKTVTSDRDTVKGQLNKYVDLLQKTSVENETLKNNINKMISENNELKNKINNMQQSLGQVQQSIYGVMAQSNTSMMPLMQPNTYQSINKFGPNKGIPQ